MLVIGVVRYRREALEGVLEKKKKSQQLKDEFLVKDVGGMSIEGPEDFEFVAWICVARGCSVC